MAKAKTPKKTYEQGLNEGFDKSIAALNSAVAGEYWRMCANGEIVAGSLIWPNKNDWAAWLEKNKEIILAKM